jgi:hypothetical protein
MRGSPRCPRQYYFGFPIRLCFSSRALESPAFLSDLVSYTATILDLQDPNTDLQNLPRAVHTLTRLTDPKSFPLSLTGSSHRHDIV